MHLQKRSQCNGKGLSSRYTRGSHICYECLVIQAFHVLENSFWNKGYFCEIFRMIQWVYYGMYCNLD